MFEELMREIDKLCAKPHRLSITAPVDHNRFYDRECPNPECGASFKVFFEDWLNKVKDQRAFCPFCRHEAPSSRWETPEQVEHIHSAGQAEATRMVDGALTRAVARSRPTQIQAGLLAITVSLSHKPGGVPTVVPPKARDVLRQEFCCETCGCRYASLGASFFCPACGHNSATSAFDNTLRTVRTTISSMSQIRAAVEQNANSDVATDAARQLTEDQFPRLVGAFERLNEALFERLPSASTLQKKGSVFQRIDEASALWHAASSKGYHDFLSGFEMQRLKLLFQRRHILSHCQGIVDEKYIASTGDTAYAPGQRLVVKECDVLEMADVLAKVAQGIRSLVP